MIAQHERTTSSGAAAPDIAPSAADHARPAARPVLSASRRRRGLVFLALACAGVGVTMALQSGLNANFLAGEIGITGLQMGLVEAARETCGIVAFLLLAVLAGMAEPIIGAAMLAVLAAGLGAYSVVPDFTWVVLMSLVWSQGLHVWMPLPNSMAMALAEPERLGQRMGQVQGAAAAGFLGGTVVALVLTWLGVAIRPMYVLAGGAALLAAAACLGIPRDVKVPGPRLVIRKRYRLYYLLSFLEGWRRQVTVAFGGYLLVRQHGAPLTHMLGLQAAIQLIGYVTFPRVGRLIDRVGERRVLTAYYICMIVLFAGYALVPSRAVLYGVFVLDGACFVLALALTTYVGRIAPHAEHTATLSMGIAANHVAAVLMPLTGGLMWATLGYRATFAIGILAAGMSIPVVQLLPTRKT